MEDWQPHLVELDGRLEAWNQAVALEFAKIAKERRLGGLFRRPRPAELEAAAVEARRRAGAEILAEVAALFDLLCDRFLVALPQERAKIRAKLGDHQALWELFWPYVESAPARLRRPSDAAELERGLAALAIDDLRHDLQLVDGVTGRMVVAAAAAGLDWRGALAKVAAVANRSTSGGASHMSDYLAGFERSKHFEEHVAAELASATRRAREGFGDPGFRAGAVA